VIKIYIPRDIYFQEYVFPGIFIPAIFIPGNFYSWEYLFLGIFIPGIICYVL